MGNRKANKWIKCLVSVSMMMAVMMVMVVPSYAAKEYKVSFKVGSKGTYNDGSTSYDDKVEINGSLNVAPDTLVANLDIEEGYYFNGWNYTVQQDNITKSASYVAQYKRIINEAVYRVRYVDNYGNELATQKVAVSNVGIVVAENAIQIDGYAVDQLTKTATVEAEGTEIVFNYVSTAGGDVETVVQQEVVVVAVPGAGTGAGAAGTGGAGTAGTGTTDGDGNAAGGTGGLGTEEIEDQEVPLAANESSISNKNNQSYLLFGGCALIVVAALVLMFLNKKKGNQSN